MADANSNQKPTEDAPKRSSLRWDNLSGFQRDILRALYLVEAKKRDLTDNAARGYVAAHDVRHQLADFPTYNGDTADSNRFYPASKRLENRDWITINPTPKDGRHRQYALTSPGRDVIEAALETDATIVASSNRERLTQATLPDGGDRDV